MPGPRSQSDHEFWIDVGGTFTDCLLRQPNGRLKAYKLLSSGRYRGLAGEGSTRERIKAPQLAGAPDGTFKGFRLVLEEGVQAIVSDSNGREGALILAQPLAHDLKPGARYELSSSCPAPVLGIRWLLGLAADDPIGPVQVRLGTTRGTNALLQQTGAPTAFVTTRGFGDMLSIGDQSRPRLFDLNIRKPAPLYQAVVEVDERIDAQGRMLQPLDEEAVHADLLAVRSQGIRAVAICLLNSYRNPKNEDAIAAIADRIGFDEISTSFALSGLQGWLPRAETTVINAYLGPVVRSYMDELQLAMPQADLKLMTSSGALVGSSEFVARDSILSGPAGGVVGCAAVGRRLGCDHILGFDMGGTSTDACRYAGEFERRYQMSIEDRATGGKLRVVAPMLSIETVAAGGGSICTFDGIMPTVGPASAGADPGPACYGNRGPLCITDVNFYLGRIREENFPLPLDRCAVEQRLDELLERILRETGKRYERDELAAGFVDIANAHMVKAIRSVSIRRGYDPRDYAMVSFGGAGGQHACAIAAELGIQTIVMPIYAGVLSAYGIGMADVVKFRAADIGASLSMASLERTAKWFCEAEAEMRYALARDGFTDDCIGPLQRRLELRYQGQDATLTIAEPPDRDWRSAFESMHTQQYGFHFPGRAIEIRSARAEIGGLSEAREASHAAASERPTNHNPVIGHAVFNHRQIEVPIHQRRQLTAGTQIDGPAMILEARSTVVVEPGWQATVHESGDLVLDRAAAQPQAVNEARADTNCDPITLELFNNRFADSAEQMGAMLQRTAISTNVKDRMDFSCAVFDADGALVSHAPHIPIHLGAMGHCVRCLLEDLEGIKPGEVYVTNDPFRGGSHLPDVTVITPVFDEAGTRVRFFAANRAHHAEIGGRRPGSMAPDSRSLAEEGVLLRRIRLTVSEDERTSLNQVNAELRPAFEGGPYPSRAVEQNLADLHAQIAANRRGANLLKDMVSRYGYETTRAYMRHIQSAAESHMRSAISKLQDGTHEFTDSLDDGTRIVVNIMVENDQATVDFTGSDPKHAGSLNATPAIVASATLYCFRCLIRENTPMNEGALAPIQIVLPSCFLNPEPGDGAEQCPAVAGGNVETSQRLVDTILGAFGLVAASSGTMNNFSFGNAQFGYYETIGGGSGAGEGFNGASAVHTHMTNTRLTDPEVLEDRYPVRLIRSAIRTASGGSGLTHGGDGMIRQMEFLAPLDVSLLTQRREVAPYGMAGGNPGRVGVNRLRRVGAGREEEIPGVCRFAVTPGDVLTIETPGGGGYGPRGGKA